MCLYVSVMCLYVSVCDMCDVSVCVCVSCVEVSVMYLFMYKKIDLKM